MGNINYFTQQRITVMVHLHLVKFTYLYKDNRASTCQVTYSSEVNGNEFTVEYSSVRGLALSWLIFV